jgi:hypothetical protein
VSQPAYAYSPTPEIPPFEGRDVAYVVIKISGLGRVQTERTPVFSIDDLVRLIGEYRCIGVFHRQDNDGELYRVQVLTPKDIDTCPWEPADPHDDGIIRARP